MAKLRLLYTIRFTGWAYFSNSSLLLSHTAKSLTRIRQTMAFSLVPAAIPLESGVVYLLFNVLCATFS